MSSIVVTIIVVAVIVLFIILVSYIKAPPSVAYIVSGLNRKPRIYIGKGGLRVPLLERLDKVFLGQVTADIRTSRTVPTNDFLNMSGAEISKQVQDSLEGNMREVIGSLSLRDININRDKFSDEIMSKAQKDMEALGLRIISCNIQNVTDEKNLIEDLGADNTWTIRKQAKINKANAERDIAMAEAEAMKQANDAQVDSQTQIAIRQNELAVKKSELTIIEQTKKADADAAYEIQRQEQQKTINTKTVDAKIEQTMREQVLTAERVKIRENELAAEVMKKSDADKYQVELKAAADLEQSKREAEAEAYRAEQEARAQIALAQAKKQAMVLEAEGIKANGEAEAYKIQKAGEAEAIAIEKKGLAEAEAMQKNGQAAILDMMVKIIPEVAQHVSEPISAIKNMNVYGTSGADAAGISGAVPAVIKQSFDVIESATGVNMTDIVRANTIEAKVTRNVNLDSDSTVDVKKKEK